MKRWAIKPRILESLSYYSKMFQRVVYLGVAGLLMVVLAGAETGIATSLPVTQKYRNHVMTIQPLKVVDDAKALPGQDPADNPIYIAAAEAPVKKMDGEPGLPARESQPIPEASTPGGAHPRKTLKLPFSQYIQWVNKKNERILMQNSQYAISLEAVQNAKSIFEPAFIGAFRYADESRRNTVQEAVSQNGLETFFQKGTDSQAAVEGLIRTGGSIRLGSSLNAFQNSLDEEADVDREYQSFLGVNLTQPLLKNAGVTVTTTGIRVAEADSDIAFQNYRQETMRVVAEASAAYWDLYFAQEQLGIRRESEDHAAELLSVNLARVKTGKIAETEVLEAQSGLALRKSLVSEARQVLTAVTNSVRTYFSSSVADEDIALETEDQIDRAAVHTDFQDSLALAIELRPEYLSSRKRIDREDIKLVFAKNQRWPQLDLKASYGPNGLADSFDDSFNELFDNDFQSWSVGVELRIPLGGDKKSRSELAATKQRKRQALLELKAVEVAIANDVDTAIKNIASTLEQVGHYANVVDLNRRLLDAEVSKFKLGKSNSRILLEREEELNLAKEAEIKSLVRYQKALLRLQLAEGALLIKNGVEPLEVDGT